MSSDRRPPRTGSVRGCGKIKTEKNIPSVWRAHPTDLECRTWLRLLAFAQRTYAMAGLDRFYFHGFIVSGFLSSVDADARSKYRVRHPDRPKHAMDAKGDAARGGQSAACLFLANNLTFPIQVDCKAVT